MSTESEPDKSKASRWRDWLELCRLPNVFTAMADPLAGALVVGASWRHTFDILILMATSACLYTGGILLNDWVDFKKDRAERPQRPLPSRRIPRTYALLAAITLFSVGGMLSPVAGWDAGQMAGALIIAIVLYDVILKDLPVALVAMGACRSFNLLMGMTLVDTKDSPVGWSLRATLAAIAGLYILGVTLFARKETATGISKGLIAGAAVTCGPLIAVALLPLVFSDLALAPSIAILVALLLTAVLYRMTQALFTPTPQRVQTAVKTAVLGVILLDAAMVALTRAAPISLLVVVLLIPAIWLGRRLYST